MPPAVILKTVGLPLAPPSAVVPYKFPSVPWMSAVALCAVPDIEAMQRGKSLRR